MSFKRKQSINKPVKPTLAEIVTVVVGVTLILLLFVACGLLDRLLDNSPAKMVCFIISNVILFFDTLGNLIEVYREGARNDDGSPSMKKIIYFIILIALFYIYIVFVIYESVLILSDVSALLGGKDSFKFAHLYDSMAITMMGTLLSVLTSHLITRFKKLVASPDDETPRATRPPVDSRR